MVVINHEHKITYFGLPKVASTSIKLMFYEIEHGTEALAELTRNRKNIHFRYPTTVAASKAARARYPDYWKVALVRDPVKRALSTYSNRVLQHRDLVKGRLPRVRATMLGLPLTPTPDQFFGKLRRYCLQSGSVRHHLAPQSVFLGRDLELYDAIYKLEDLAEFIDEISRRTGRELVLPHSQKAQSKLTLDMISASSMAALRRFYAKDYKVLADHYALEGAS